MPKQLTSRAYLDLEAVLAEEQARERHAAALDKTAAEVVVAAIPRSSDADDGPTVAALFSAVRAAADRQGKGQRHTTSALDRLSSAGPFANVRRGALRLEPREGEES